MMNLDSGIVDMSDGVNNKRMKDECGVGKAHTKKGQISSRTEGKFLFSL